MPLISAEFPEIKNSTHKGMEFLGMGNGALVLSVVVGAA